MEMVGKKIYFKMNKINYKATTVIKSKNNQKMKMNLYMIIRLKSTLNYYKYIILN